MEKKLTYLLKQCREIEPSETFKRESLRSILNAPQHIPSLARSLKLGVIEHVKLSAALGLATVLVFVALFGTFSLNGTVPHAKDAGAILGEAQKADFQIQLREAEYFAESAEEIATLLQEIESGGYPHGNEGTAGSELIN